MTDLDLCSGFTVEGDSCPREHDADGRHLHPADDGHTFRINVLVRGSYGVVGEPHHTDSTGFHQRPFVREIRAWDLAQALRVASQLPLASWAIEEDDSPVEQARAIAVELENQIAAAIALHTPNPEQAAFWESSLPLCPTCMSPAPCPTAIALGAEVLVEQSHYAESFRVDAPDLRWGWQCLTCELEQYVGDAATAEMMATAHTEGRLLVIDGLTLLWPEGRKPGAGYPTCPGCGHDFGNHRAITPGWDIACPACFNVGASCTADQAAVFAAIQAAER